MTLLGQLKPWQNLAILIAAMALPTALLAVLYLNAEGSVVSTARNELDGARYLQTLGTALAHIANHRSRSHALLNGDNSRREDVFAAQNDIDRALTELDTLNAELGESFKSGQQWQAVKAQWS